MSDNCISSRITSSSSITRIVWGIVPFETDQNQQTKRCLCIPNKLRLACSFREDSRDEHKKNESRESIPTPASSAPQLEVSSRCNRRDIRFQKPDGSIAHTYLDRLRVNCNPSTRCDIRYARTGCSGRCGDHHAQP